MLSCNMHEKLCCALYHYPIDIGSSSPLGEVKSSLNCDAALRTGLNLNRNGSRQTLSEDKKKSFWYVQDITKGFSKI